jgi:hypothetical protein
MSKNKVVKSVSFNVTNEQDQEYLEWIQNVDNFSGYVKSLIEGDLQQEESAQEEKLCIHSINRSRTATAPRVSHPNHICAIFPFTSVIKLMTRYNLKVFIYHILLGRNQ